MNRVFQLKIIRPKFDELYKEYEEKNKTSTSSKRKVEACNLIPEPQYNMTITMKGDNISENGKKDLRRKILECHYNFSEGNSLNLVSRTEVAEKLDFNDDNDPKLLGAIKYLEDKGFLKVVTNVQDQITDLGIDEVENNCPNFFDDQNKFSANQPNIGKVEIIGRDKIEQHGNKSRARIENIKNNHPKKKPWYLHWLMLYLVYPVVVGLIILGISKFFK